MNPSNTNNVQIHTCAQTAAKWKLLFLDIENNIGQAIRASLPCNRYIV